MVRALVLSKVRYSGAWTTPTKQTLTELESKMENTVLPTQIRGRSRFLLWTTVLGPDLHPGHCLDLECLRHETWRIRKAASLQIRGRAVQCLPQQASRWKDIMQKWEWCRSLGSTSGYNTPDGYIDIARVGAPALKALTDRAFGRLRWREDKRCHEHLFARVDRHTVACAPAHRDIATDALANGDLPSLRAALGAAADYRVVKALAAKQGRVGDVTCACGLVDPDREHRMWNCIHNWTNHTGHRRASAPLRMTLAERKLAVYNVHKGKRGEIDEVQQQDVDVIAQSLCSAAASGVVDPIIATDGGATGDCVFNGYAAWAVATDDAELHGNLHSFDSSSYYAELFAALVALCAIAQSRIRARLIIDNRAV